jgi:hypothetical protein
VLFPGGEWWSTEDEDVGTWGLAGESRFWVGDAEGLVSFLVPRGRARKSIIYIDVSGSMNRYISWCSRIKTR